MKPTEEQIKELWEKLADDVEHYNEDKHRHYRFGEEWTEDEPSIDLNNLFRWAVPKVIAGGHWLGMITTEMSSGTQYTFAIYVQKYKTKPEHEASNKDPALALFWAIWEVIGK